MSFPTFKYWAYMFFCDKNLKWMLISHEVKVQSRFQGSISSTVYAQLFWTQIPKAKKTGKSSVPFLLLGSLREKAACKMLIKLTLGVNFTNILQAASILIDSKRKKNTVKPSSFFWRFWDLCLKKLHVKMLVKLTPVVNFINILQAAFVPKKLQTQTVIREKL